jgi:hypothetical protein
MNNDPPLTEPVLRELSRAEAVRAVEVKALVGGGFGVSVWTGPPDSPLCRALSTSRGEVRRFALLDTAATFLRSLGLCRFNVDVAQHEAGRLRPARPDRSEALRRTRTTPRQSSLLP